MRFGDIPTWAKELSTCIRELVEYSDYDPESMNTNTCEIEEQERIFPSELLHREPLFNALIANSYQPGEVRFQFRPIYLKNGSIWVIFCL